MMHEIAPSSVEDQGPAAIPKGKGRAALIAVVPDAGQRWRIDASIYEKGLRCRSPLPSRQVLRAYRPLPMMNESSSTVRLL